MIKFTTQLNSKKLISAVLIATTQTVVFKIIVALWLFFLLESFAFIILKIGQQNNILTVFLFGGFYFVLTFLISFIRSRTDKRIYEKNEWVIDDKCLTRKGQTFEMKISIDSIYQIKETKNWIFIWINKSYYFILDKSDLQSDSLLIFKEIFKKNV